MVWDRESAEPGEGVGLMVQGPALGASFVGIAAVDEVPRPFPPSPPLSGDGVAEDGAARAKLEHHRCGAGGESERRPAALGPLLPGLRPASAAGGPRRATGIPGRPLRLAAGTGFRSSYGVQMCGLGLMTDSLLQWMSRGVMVMEGGMMPPPAPPPQSVASTFPYIRRSPC